MNLIDRADNLIKVTIDNSPQATLLTKSLREDLAMCAVTNWGEINDKWSERYKLDWTAQEPIPYPDSLFEQALKSGLMAWQSVQDALGGVDAPDEIAFEDVWSFYATAMKQACAEHDKIQRPDLPRHV